MANKNKRQNGVKEKQKYKKPFTVQDQQDADLGASPTKKAQVIPPPLPPVKKAVAKQNNNASVLKLPGKWVSKRITEQVEIFASFDAQDQFMTMRLRRSNKNAEIQMEDGSVVLVRDIWPCKAESVHIYWPIRPMPLSWLNPRLHEERLKQKQLAESSNPTLKDANKIVDN